MSQLNICNYGNTLLEDCMKNRHYFDLVVFNINSIIHDISNHVNIDLENYKFMIIPKTNKKGFSMKWHIDDVAMIKTNKNAINDECGIIIGDKQKYRLYHKLDLPIYSAIIYLSEYNVDFTGGEFEFLNQKIEPKKNHVLFFDSREVHRVNIVKSGIRENILIKFYKIN